MAQDDLTAAFGTPVEPEPAQTTDIIEDIAKSVIPENIFSAPQLPATEPDGTQPTVTPQAEPQSTDNKNDQKRFEYWQAQAAKLQNQLNEVEPYMPMVAKYKETGVPPTAEPAKAEPTKEFPQAPEQPKKPYNFTYTEAEDPNSTTSQYLRDMEDWQSGMQQWTVLKGQYDSAIMKEQYDKLSGQLAGFVEKQNKSAQDQKAATEAAQYVEANFGMESDAAREFVQWGSDPANLKMENLVRLFLMGKGVNMQQTQGIPQPPQQQPSGAFLQKSQAAQATQPLSQIPSNEASTTETDMINDVFAYDKAANPFG